VEKRDTVRKVLVSVSAVLIFALLAVIFGCAPAEVTPTPPKPPAVEKEPIFLGSFMDQTGPIAPYAIHMVKPMYDYFDYLNKEKGGIEGYPIKYVNFDSEYDPGKCITQHHRFAAGGCVFYVSIGGSNLGEALKPFLEKDKIPAFTTGSSDPQLKPPGWIFQERPSYSENFAASVDWILENWTKDRPLKIAFVTWDNPYGRGMFPGIPYIEAKGVKVVATAFVPGAPIDVTAQLLKIKEAKPDHVFMNLPNSVSSVVLNGAEMMGIRKEMTWWVNSGNVCTFMGLAELTHGACDGTHYPHQFATWEERELPGVKLMWELSERYNRQDEEYQNGYPVNLVEALITEELIKRSLAEDGPPVTGEKMYKQLVKLKDFNAMKLLPGVDFTAWPGCREGSLWTRICEIDKEGKTIVLSDWRKAPRIEIK